MKIISRRSGKLKESCEEIEAVRLFGDTDLKTHSATEYHQELPEKHQIAATRMTFCTGRQDLDEAEGVLKYNKIRAQAPVEHPASVPAAGSFYFKNPVRNFLELSVSR